MCCFGHSVITLAGKAAPPRSAEAGGFSLIARETGPQVAVLEMARMLTASVDGGEEVRWVIPINNVVEPVRVMADVCVIGTGQAQVELSLGEQRVTQTIQHGKNVVLATEPVRVGAKAEIVVTTRGGDGETGIRWSNLRYALDDEVFRIPMVLPPAAETIPPRSCPTCDLRWNSS